MIKISTENILKLAKMSLEKPDDFMYWGSEDMFKTWGFAGIDNTSGDVIQESNFQVISKNLIEKFPNDFRIESFSHWAFGSIERLVCRVLINDDEITRSNISESFYEVISWHEKLSDYPIADDNHYSNLEYEKAIEDIKEIYPINLVDTTKDSWESKIHHELTYNMDFVIDRYYGTYPSNDDFMMAVYSIQLWNIDEKEEWDKWTNINGLEEIPKIKNNPNELNLFEDWKQQ